mmetsp:Transcript_5914/g.11566  ORF Transcript_5914/g.11566 Transcript_5914/m.11566 type:complete len:361 (-) Transcript_5914:371-1453(-)
MCCSRIACRHLLREHLPQAMQRGAQRAALAMHKALVGEVAAAVGRYAKPLPGLDAGAAARRGGRARPGELSPPRCRRGGGGPCCCASGRPRSPTRPSCACACRACRPTRTRTRRASCAGRRRRRDGCCGGRDDHLHRRRRGGCGGCGRVCRLRLRRRAGCADRDRADRTGRSRGRAGRSRSRGRSRRGRSRARARSRGRRALDLSKVRVCTAGISGQVAQASVGSAPVRMRHESGSTAARLAITIAVQKRNRERVASLDSSTRFNNSAAANWCQALPRLQLLQQLQAAMPRLQHSSTPTLQRSSKAWAVASEAAQVPRGSSRRSNRAPPRSGRGGLECCATCTRSSRPSSTLRSHPSIAS